MLSGSSAHLGGGGGFGPGGGGGCGPGGGGFGPGGGGGGGGLWCFGGLGGFGPPVVVPGHGFAGELWSWLALGLTIQVAELKPMLASLAALTVT